MINIPLNVGGVQLWTQIMLILFKDFVLLKTKITVRIKSTVNVNSLDTHQEYVSVTKVQRENKWPRKVNFSFFGPLLPWHTTTQLLMITYYILSHNKDLKQTSPFQLNSRYTGQPYETYLQSWPEWVTYTGLEFKEQWSTIISGRKSSLKEAMTAKSVGFSSLFFNTMKLNWYSDQNDGGKLQIVHLCVSPWWLVS